jgi:arylsulfatase A-like enzyme
MCARLLARLALRARLAPLARRAPLAPLALLALSTPWTGSCGGSPSGPQGGPASGPPANILIFVFDTLRVDRLGCYGGEGGHSPLLDARAEGFFLFEQAQTTSPWTAPALISLVTGLYPGTHGVRSFPTPERLGIGIRTLAERLQAAGYRTGAFTEGGYASPHFGLGRGFQTYPREALDGQLEGINPLGGSRLPTNIDRALEWLDAGAGQPSLLLLHTYEAHTPYRAPESIVRELRPEHDLAAERAALREVITAWNQDGRLDLTGLDLLRRHYFLRPVMPGLPEAKRTDELLARAEALGSPLDMDEIPRRPAELALVQDLYNAEVRYLDRQLERLLLALEERGLDENTIVLLVSDHGEGLGDRGRLGHGEELHDELLRMLCMLRVPGSQWQPRRIAQVVSMVDLLPTLLELAGVKYDPAELQGRSLVGVLRGAAPGGLAGSHALSSQGGQDPRVGARDDRWRLILGTDPGETELYDLWADPGALVNVAQVHPEVVREMAVRLDAMRREGDAIRARVRGSAPGEGVLDEALLRELRSFGYIESR